MAEPFHRAGKSLCHTGETVCRAQGGGFRTPSGPDLASEEPVITVETSGNAVQFGQDGSSDQASPPPR